MWQRHCGVVRSSEVIWIYSIHSGGKDVVVLISAVEKAGLSSPNEGAKASYKKKENRGKTSAENQKSADRLASDRSPAGSRRQAKNAK
jgi:cold shock CspA family protein